MATTAPGFEVDHLLWPGKPGLNPLPAEHLITARGAISQRLDDVNPRMLVTTENVMAVAGFLASMVVQMELSLEHAPGDDDDTRSVDIPAEIGDDDGSRLTWEDSKYEKWLGQCTLLLRGLIFARTEARADGETAVVDFNSYREVWPRASDAECLAWAAHKQAFFAAWDEAAKEGAESQASERSVGGVHRWWPSDDPDDL